MSDTVELILPERFSAKDVPDLHARLLAARAAGTAVTLDGSANARVDSAAAQWLVILLSGTEGRAALSGLRTSAALDAALQLVGLGDEALAFA